jgi:hypothetical protein
MCEINARSEMQGLASYSVTKLLTNQLSMLLY